MFFIRAAASSLLSFILPLGATTINWPEANSVDFEPLQGISPSDGTKFDRFGSASHYFDFTLAVSSNGSEKERNAVYIFNGIDSNGKFDSSGFQRITAPLPATAGYFGNDIAHSGDTLFIAAKSAEGTIFRLAGAVYQIIDTDKDKDFAEERMIRIDSGAFAPQLGKYGESIAANENTLVIGAPSDGADGTTYIIFDHGHDGDYSNDIQQKISSPDNIGYTKFGYSVALFGDTVAIGAPGNYNGSGEYPGAVYILVDSDKDGLFNEETIQTIKPPVTGYNDQFGISVALSEHTLVIGRVGYSNPENGAVYVVNDTDKDGDYAEEELVRLDLPPSGYLGRKVNLYNSTIFVSSYKKIFHIKDSDVDGDFAEEAIYAFSSTTEGAKHTAYGNQLVVSNIFSSTLGTHSGAVTIFEKVGQHYVEIAENLSEVSLLIAKSSDEQPIKYTLEDSYDADLFTIDENTGQLSFKAPANFENPLASSYYNSDIYRVKIKANSDTSYSYANVDIEVTDVNEPPYLEKPLSNQEVNEDNAFTYIIQEGTFADEDIDDSLTYTATLNDDSDLPAWLSFDSEGLLFSGVPENSDVGQLLIKVTAKDTAENEANTHFILTVHNTNDAPFLNIPIDDMDTDEDSQFSFSVPENTFLDEDVGDVLSYKSTLLDNNELPEWLVFDKESLQFNGTPTNADVGELIVKLTATDREGVSAETGFSILVINTNDSPIAVDDYARTNDTTSITINALDNDTDEDGDKLVLLSVTAQNGKVSITNSKEEIFYTPKKGFVGDDIIQYSITDNNGGESKAMVTVTVSLSPSPAVEVPQPDKSSGGSMGIYFFILIIFRLSVVGFSWPVPGIPGNDKGQ